MLQIALPNKGGLSEDAVDLVRAAGYRCRRYSRELVVRDAQHEIEFVFLRPRDIAVYVANGIIDLGVTGRDLVMEREVDVEELLRLGFGRSKFYYAVPEDSDLTPATFSPVHRISTSYPSLVRQDLRKRGREAQVVRLDGAVEISIQLGVADAIADVVQSGRTLDEAGLKRVGDPIVESEAVLIGRTTAALDDLKVTRFVERLRGIIVARDYVMVEYDMPAALLDEASAVTPGIEAPTVAPLSREGWVAVKAMAKQHRVNEIMDRLADLGAKGIIVTDIRTCRI
ncbi:MAG: ATP phosphoribosyltransferase [Bacteroidota bacterium]